jgi:MFS family permease
MAMAPDAPNISGLARRFPALAYPNFRLWFVGQIISLFGTWMQMTALGYLVYELTRSPAYLGYVSFAAGLPTWLITLYAGVIADRLPRRWLLVVTQTAMMALAFVLTALTATGMVQPWHIIVLAFLLGICNAFDAPARQAFTLEMVERRDLANAIALNSTMFNAGTAVGPAVAGFVYALFGPAWCFFLNGLSFLAVIAALIAMKLQPMARSLRRSSTLTDLKEGLSYTLHEPTIRTLILVVGSISLFAMSYATLVPAWAVNILGGDSRTNGLMQSARGVGALIAAFTIAAMGRFNFKGKVLMACTFALPIMLLIFAQVRSTPLSLLVLVGVGMAFMPVMTLGNSLVQSLVPDALRGRVMSMWTLVIFGMMPLGGLWVGAVAQSVGEPAAVAIGASISLAVAAGVFVFFPRIRKLE